jgi:hypothetical protein
MKATTYAVINNSINFENKPELICFETYNADNRPDECFDVTVTYKLVNDKYILSEVYMREDFETQSEEDQAVLKHFARKDSEKLMQSFMTTGSLTDSEEITSSTDDIYLDGRLLEEDQEVSEIKTLMSAVDSVQDGDYFVLSAGNLVLDFSLHSSEDIHVHAVDEYTQLHNEIYNVSHCQDMKFEKLIKTCTYLFTFHEEAQKFAFEQVKKFNASIN